MARVLVIGFGNPLRSDDALGWRVAEWLDRMDLPSDVEVLTCHQLNPELAEPISRAQLVIFVDAAEPGALLPRGVLVSEPAASASSGAPPSASATASAFAVSTTMNRVNTVAPVLPNDAAEPGTIREFELEPTCESVQCFSHQVTPSTLLACAAELFGSTARARLLSVVASDFGMGEQLSPAVEASVPELVRRIMAAV